MPTSKRNHTIAITDGTTTVTLSAGNWTLRNGNISIIPPEVRVLMHTPDFGFSRPVRGDNPVREARLVMDYDDSTGWDSLINNLVPLKRLIDGESQRALRYWIHGDVPAVYLDVTPIGATNKTRHRILYGQVDDSMAYYAEEATNKYKAARISIILYLAPLAEMTAFTMINHLGTSTSPHFITDLNSDGRATGWDLDGTPSSVTLDTTNWLVGGQSQRIVCDAGGEGIRSQVVATGSSTTAVAYAWFRVTTGTITFRLRNTTAASNVDTASVTSAGSADSDKSTTDSAGATWYRVVLSGSFTAGNSIRLEFLSTAASDDWNVDACYLEVGTTTAPPGWMSSYRIENRNDIQDTNATTRAYFNSLDTWGIPGDEDALALWKLTAQSVGLGFYAGRMVDGTYLAVQQDHWIESDEQDAASATGNGVWSTQADANTTNGSYRRFTEGTSNLGGYTEFNYTGSDLRKLAATPRRVIALVNSNQAACTFKFDVYADSTNFTPENVATTVKVAATTWHLLDLGILNLTGIVPADVPDTTEPTFALRVTIAGLSSTNTAAIDAIFLPPVIDDYMIYNIQVGSGFGANQLWVNGNNETVIPEDRGFDRHDWKGSLWNLSAGPIMSRTVFMTFANSTQYTYDLTAGFDIKLTVTPRTRHLMGTL